MAISHSVSTLRSTPSTASLRSQPSALSMPASVGPSHLLFLSSLPYRPPFLGLSPLAVSSFPVALTPRSALSWIRHTAASVSSILILRTLRLFLYWSPMLNPTSRRHARRPSDVCGRMSTRGFSATSVSSNLKASLRAPTTRSSLYWLSITPWSARGVLSSRTRRSLLSWSLMPNGSTVGQGRLVGSLFLRMLALSSLRRRGVGGVDLGTSILTMGLR